jgi:hypothetical protein
MILTKNFLEKAEIQPAPYLMRGQGRNDRGDPIQIIIHNNARIFLFLGKDHLGFSFLLIFMALQWFFKRSEGKLPPIRRVLKKGEREGPRPEWTPRIFSPSKGKKN